MNIPRRTKAVRWAGGLLAAASAWALVACGGGSSSDTAGDGTRSATPLQATTTADAAASGSTTSSSDTTLATAMQKESSGSTTTLPKNTDGRLLASNCFQCHGTNGNGGFESIRGGEAKEVLEYLTKPASREIMAAHAQGYTTAQLQKIIAYLQQ